MVIVSPVLGAGMKMRRMNVVVGVTAVVDVEELLVLAPLDLDQNDKYQLIDCHHHYNELLQLLLLLLLYYQNIVVVAAVVVTVVK